MASNTRGIRNFLTLFAALLIGSISCASGPQMTSRMDGNREIIDAVEGGAAKFRLIYTIENGRKVRGEYWEPSAAGKKDVKEPESNILASTAFAKKIDQALAGQKVADDSGIELNQERDGFTLKFVKQVRYNNQGLPELVLARGITTLPVVGTFRLKTNYRYIYDGAGRLSQIRETNMNVDSVLLNLGIGNITTILRDGAGRPVQVIKAIGSVPPAVEKTVYTYYGATPNIQKTVYQKCGINLKKLAITPSETITTLYGPNVPWDGKQRYDFSFGTNITGFVVYDEVEKKNKVDGSGFTKMSWAQKAMFTKNIYDYVKNEMRGPSWRMGDLPDTPEPFRIYKDQTWWK